MPETKRDSTPESALEQAIHDYLGAKFASSGKQYDRSAPNVQAVIAAVLKVVVDFASNPTAILGDVVALFQLLWPFPTPTPIPTPTPTLVVPGGIPGLGAQP